METIIYVKVGYKKFCSSESPTLVMANGGPLGGVFYPNLTLMVDSYRFWKLYRKYWNTSKQQSEAARRDQ